MIQSGWLGEPHRPDFSRGRRIDAGWGWGIDVGVDKGLSGSGGLQW